MKVGLAAIVLACELLAQQPPTVRSRTTLVPIDVRVVDAGGKPMTDLKKEDFTVLENGAPQTVRLFATHALTAEAPPAAPPADGLLAPWREMTAGVEPSIPNARVFVMAFGRGRLQAPAKGVDAAIAFVRDRLLPQDRVAVMAWNRATNFTTDRASLLTLLERFKKDHLKVETDLREHFSGLRAVFSGGEIPPEIQREIDAVFAAGGTVASHRVTGLTATGTTRMAEERRQTLNDLLAGDSVSAELTAMGLGLDEFAATTLKAGQEVSALYAAIRYLRQFDGDKHVIFVNEGGIFLPRLEHDEGLAAFANDARVSIHTIRTGGLMTMSPLVQRCSSCPTEVDVNNMGRVAPSQMSSNQTVRNIAALTGGVTEAYGSIERTLDDIDRVTRFQYLLGYMPSNATWDGRYRRVTVRVNRKDARVLYRHGYYANDAPTPAGRNAFLTYTRIADAGSLTQPVTELAVSATAQPLKDAGEVVLSITIRVDKVKFVAVEGRHHATIQVATFCGAASEAIVGDTWQTVDLNLSDETHTKLLADGVTFTQRIPVRGEPKYAKVVAYDYASDRTGSAIVKLQK